MSEYIDKQTALNAICTIAQMNMADINHHYLMGFQEAAEAVQNCPDVWHNPEKDLPTSMDFVLVLISGMADGRQCEQAPFIASFAPDDGWVLESIPDRPDDSWKVDKWMEIPWEETK